MRTAASSLLLLLLAAGCAGGRSPVRYVGPAPTCGRSEGGGTTATLTRLGSGFALAPYDGVLVVDGSVARDGALSGALPLRPAQISSGGPPGEPSRGAGEKPKPGPAQAITVSGALTAETAAISYAAPGCSAALRLARVHPALL